MNTHRQPSCGLIRNQTSHLACRPRQLMPNERKKLATAATATMASLISIRLTPRAPASSASSADRLDRQSLQHTLQPLHHALGLVEGALQLAEPGRNLAKYRPARFACTYALRRAPRNKERISPAFDELGFSVKPDSIRTAAYLELLLESGRHAPTAIVPSHNRECERPGSASL